ncbi:unnamed protein product [Pocillopora meandrina]|uniref:Uncharacterized protein n=1 Tax=Pocillopora meandrina TaxID=46732 RepID=A0AAU9WSF7_9CNID|nr:unnamed protein product [Pocillopora meandrina]CAH3167977.1 unnamed protein product [Pocillopora meandrina]
MVCHCRKDQGNLFNGKIKLSVKWKTMGCFMPKYLELDKRILEWLTEQRSQEVKVPRFCQPLDQTNTRSASSRRFGAANSQVPLICNHIPSASQLFPIKNPLFS